MKLSLWLKVHPGYTGQAFIANELIKAINEIKGLSAPLHDLDAIIQTDPYVDHDGDGFAPLPGYEGKGFTELIYFFRDLDDGNIEVGRPTCSRVSKEPKK